VGGHAGRFREGRALVGGETEAVSAQKFGHDKGATFLMLTTRARTHANTRNVSSRLVILTYHHVS
jgi:hypothetical protein